MNNLRVRVKLIKLPYSWISGICVLPKEDPDDT
jgi:hypothetical protein